MQAVPRPNRYRQATYLMGAQKLHQVPPDNGLEVAFAGRSNAGKSSAINTITDIKSLARTSKTPGRTQLINFFTLDPERRLVDLPGYGYAKVPEAIKRQWQHTLQEYLHQRQALQGLVLVMDVRHPLTEYDRVLLDWCQSARMAVHILLTKADKLKRGPANNALLQVRKTLKAQWPGSTVQLFSALNKTGVDQVREHLDQWFRYDGETHAVSDSE